MKKAEREPRYEYVAIPLSLVLYQTDYNEAEFRLLLYFYGAEYVTQTRGVSVPLAELAENTGLEPEQAQAALTSLERRKFVAAEGRGVWRRLPVKGKTE